MMKFKYHNTDKLKTMLRGDVELEHKVERFIRSVLVDRFMRDNGVSSMSFKDEAEPSFSHAGCDICTPGLGNSVYEVVGYNRKTKEVVDLGEVCSLCIEVNYNGV